MGAMTPSMRGKLLGKLADLLAENSEAIGRIETKDTGKMFKETRWQCQYIAEYLRYMLAQQISCMAIPCLSTSLICLSLPTVNHLV